MVNARYNWDSCIYIYILRLYHALIPGSIIIKFMDLWMIILLNLKGFIGNSTPQPFSIQSTVASGAITCRGLKVDHIIRWSMHTWLMHDINEAHDIINIYIYIYLDYVMHWWSESFSWNLRHCIGNSWVIFFRVKLFLLSRSYLDDSRWSVQQSSVTPLVLCLVGLPQCMYTHSSPGPFHCMCEANGVHRQVHEKMVRPRLCH